MARTSRKESATVNCDIASESIAVYPTAIYLRLSVEDNGKKDADSLDNQREFLKQYVLERPYLELVQIYTDNGFTGTDFERPAFNRMIEDVKKGLINCIVVKDLSRLGRNYVDAGNLLEKVFPFLNVRFIAVNDHYDSEVLTSDGQLSATLKNVVNDIYAKDISRKVSTALKSKRLRGEFIANYAPYGYLKDPADKNHLVIDPEVAHVVVEFFEMRASGAGISSIIRALNEKGYPSPGRLRFERGIITNNNKKGSELPWNRHVLNDLLHNIVYIGHLAQGRSKRCLYQGISFHWTNKSEWDIVENTHEPIISHELWERVQAVNDCRTIAAKESHGKYAALAKRENPYGSLLRCADCGRVMKLVRSYAKGGNKDYYNYKCPENIELGDEACPKKNIRADDLDIAVLATIRKQMDLFLDTQTVLKHLIALEKETLKHAAPPKRLLEMEAIICKKRELSATLYMDYKDGILSQDEYSYAKEKYQMELASLEKEIAELKSMQIKTNEVLEGERKWERLIAKYAQAQKITKTMIVAFVKSITLHADNSISIEFKYMDEFNALLRECVRIKKEVA